MKNDTENTPLKTFGQNVRKYRKEAKLSQKELAKKVGISHEWLCKIENGKTSALSVSLMIKLKKELGISTSIVITDMD